MVLPYFGPWPLALVRWLTQVLDAAKMKRLFARHLAPGRGRSPTEEAKRLYE